jgi:hypothetical protein
MAGAFGLASLGCKTMKILLLLPTLVFAMLTGCGSDPMSNDDFIAEVAQCEANGYAARTLTSGWDGDRTGVQCYTPHVFKPRTTEFKLADGTRCDMFSTSPDNSRRAGASGASSDWDSAE